MPWRSQSYSSCRPCPTSMVVTARPCIETTGARQALTLRWSTRPWPRLYRLTITVQAPHPAQSEERLVALTSLPAAKLGPTQPQLGPQEGQQGEGGVGGGGLHLGEGSALLEGQSLGHLPSIDIEDQGGGGREGGRSEALHGLVWGGSHPDGKCHA